MTYFNNQYSQQAYQGQMNQLMQPSMMPGQAGQFNGYSQMPMYQQPQMAYPPQQIQGYSQQAPKVDFQGVVVSSFDDVKTYPVPLGGTVLLLNRSAGKFYLKSLGENGVPIIETYDFSVSQASSEDSKGVGNEQSVNPELINKLADRIDKLTSRLSNCENSIKSISK